MDTHFLAVPMTGLNPLTAQSIAAAEPLYRLARLAAEGKAPALCGSFAPVTCLGLPPDVLVRLQQSCRVYEDAWRTAVRAAAEQQGSTSPAASDDWAQQEEEESTFPAASDGFAPYEEWTP